MNYDILISFQHIGGLSSTVVELIVENASSNTT